MNLLLTTVLLLGFLKLIHESSSHPSIQKSHEVGFEATPKLNSILLNNVTFSEYGTIYLLLLQEKTIFDYNTLIQRIAASPSNSFQQKIDSTTKNLTIELSGLRRNTTYHLYYFGENYIDQARTKLKVIPITTKINEPIRVYMPNYIDQFFTLMLPILFVVCLFLYFKKLDEEKDKNESKSDCMDVCSSYRSPAYNTSPSVIYLSID